MQQSRIPYTLLLAVALLLGTSGCRGNSQNNTEVETAQATDTPVKERVVSGLQEPVALVFLSNDILLVAERRSGRIRWVERGQLRAQPFATLPVPPVVGYVESGLLGLAADPGYPTRPYVYAFHTMPDAQRRPVRQRIVRFTVQNGRGVNPTVIVDNLPVSTGCCHFGGRIFFGPDGRLYVTLGDTLRPASAQRTDTLAGKVLRYNPDGTIPTDNPFNDTPIAGMNLRGNPVFTYGHRNPFGITANPADGQIYSTENGPTGHDEINHLVAGRNYGWPTVMGYSNDPRFVSPLWESGASTLAPTGARFYTGDAFPQFRGAMLFAAYRDGRLRRVTFTNADRIGEVAVIAEAETDARLDVAIAPDGSIYFSSTNAIYRLRLRTQ